MNIDSLPVYGSDMLPSDTLDKIGLWDFGQAVPFDEEYLAGFYSDVADTNYEDIKGKAAAVGDQLFKKASVKRADGSYCQYCSSTPFFETTKTPEYVLVPIWFITLENKNAPRTTFMVNAQTGQSIGKIPIRYKSFFLGVLKKTLILSILFSMIPVLVSVLCPVGTVYFLDMMLVSCITGVLPLALLVGGIALLIAYRCNKAVASNTKTTIYSGKRIEV